MTSDKLKTSGLFLEKKNSKGIFCVRGSQKHHPSKYMSRTHLPATWRMHFISGQGSGSGKRDYLQRQQANTFQRFIGVHFNFLRSGKNFQVSDVLASQIRALVRQTDRGALTSRTKKRAFVWGASGLTLMVLAILNACKRGKCSAAREAPCFQMQLHITDRTA